MQRWRYTDGSIGIVPTWGGMGWRWPAGHSGCSCGCVPEVWLGRSDIQGIAQVKIDGDVVPPSSYRLDRRSYLVRTDGDQWPSCQAIALDDSEEGTFSVSFWYGEEPTDLAVAAASALACQLWAACNNAGRCKLPKGTQSVVRGGTVIQLGALLAESLKIGSTGILAIDTFVVGLRRRRRRHLDRVVARPAEPAPGGLMANGTGPGDLFDLADELLDVCTEALDSIPTFTGLEELLGSPSTASSPTPAPIADCCDDGMLAVHVNAVSDQFARPPAPASPKANVPNLIVTVLRCLPLGEVDGDSYTPPTRRGGHREREADPRRRVGALEPHLQPDQAPTSSSPAASEPSSSAWSRSGPATGSAVAGSSRSGPSCRATTRSSAPDARPHRVGTTVGSTRCCRARRARSPPTCCAGRSTSSRRPS